MKKAVIIGSGFAGLSVACFMARAGWEVTVLEKHSTPGGRGRQMSVDGFVFDMGPSWYWMPDVFERFFNCFGKKVSDYYQLERLEPSYRVYWPDTVSDIPADYGSLKNLFESIEHGSSKKLDSFLQEAKYKYSVGIDKLVHKPGQSFFEFLDTDLIKGIFKLDVFTSMTKHISKHFKNPRLQQLMEFPVLFLGALAQDTPALYSLMNYADIKLGTWYPRGGMYKIVDAMYDLAKELGVKFFFDHTVQEIIVDKSIARNVAAKNSDKKILYFDADVVIGGADYQFIESKLLPEKYRTYSNEYWDKRTMAPSCLLYYVGLNKKLPGILHHSLFFDVDFELHGKEIYSSPDWPSNPLFYVSAPSVTDSTVAPPGCENLFFLIPVASGLENDSEELREKYFNLILDRYEKKTGHVVRDSIVFKKSYSISDFKEDYNAFKGNAYGLANTLMQTAVLKPSCKSKKVGNLYFTGQLTVPGPGVPPSLISGEVVSREIINSFQNK